MLQKLIMGTLALAIISVIGFGIYDATRVPDAPTVGVLPVTDVPPQTATPMPTVVIPTQTAAPTAAVIETALEAPAPEAQGLMGDPWQAMGTISALEDFGLTLTTASGDFFVELGPPSYWQSQDTVLAVGHTIAVNGFYNGEQIHPVTIIANDGKVLTLRNDSGQPAWAGGTGQGGGSAGMQVVADDWLTLTGIIDSVTNGQVVLNANDGTTLNLQMGRPEFWQSQGIALEAGDPVEVLGFWSGEQFMAGDIRKTATGETIMLRDPNGRQLWAGPGRGGQGNGGGNQGGGNGYRGGREG